MIAVRPPEYWPRPGFFGLMAEVDVFVLADSFQYSRQSFQNRARLRTPDGWQWISIPLKGGQHGRPVEEVEIRRTPHWMTKHWRALHFNYRTSPFFDFYEERLRALFETEWTTLGALTVASVEMLRSLLGVRTPLVCASKLVDAPSGLESVLSHYGGYDLLVPRIAAEADAALAVYVADFACPSYRQNFEGFERDMSALDLLFNYGPEALPMIRRHTNVRPIRTSMPAPTPLPDRTRS